MKILAIMGSPRSGNTEFMIHEILDSAKNDGADVSAIKLRKRDIKFCGGGDDCCPKTGVCKISDDMQHIYEELEGADLIILASPTYFSNVSAIMKTFMDRCNPYWFNKKLKGKRAFLVSTGAYEPSIKDAIVCMGNFLKGIHVKKIGSYHTVAEKKDEIEHNSKVIKELRDIGIRLAQEENNGKG